MNDGHNIMVQKPIKLVVHHDSGSKIRNQNNILATRYLYQPLVLKIITLKMYNSITNQ